MDQTILYNQLSHTLTDTHLEQFGERYRGKVRDTYRLEDKLILVTTDRISAFDFVLHQSIPFKGQVLNQLAAYFFDRTIDLVPNHVLSVPDPNVTVATRCETVPIEFVVRGFVAGHAWREYRAGKRLLCGVPLADGLKESSRLPYPILTPSTKAASGHDEDISRDEILKTGILDEDTFNTLESMAMDLFQRGTEMAAERGLILVDTKYEFGKKADGTFVVIDEVHTPDSSRYYYSNTYQERLEKNEPQRQLSKEFVREWLMDHQFQGKAGQVLPGLPDDFRVEVASRYIELYESITGQAFQPDTHQDPETRIRETLTRTVSR